MPLAQFLIILGTSNIAVVLPTINEHFGITQTNLQWIHNACVIAFGTVIIWMGLVKFLQFHSFYNGEQTIKYNSVPLDT